MSLQLILSFLTCIIIDGAAADIKADDTTQSADIKDGANSQPPVSAEAVKEKPLTVPGVEMISAVTTILLAVPGHYISNLMNQTETNALSYIMQSTGATISVAPYVVEIFLFTM